jgi:Fe2+ transport system protein B
VVIVVVDASNLERNPYFASQAVELGWPTILALNMADMAEKNGQTIDTARLAEALGAPVIPTVASDGRGVPELKRMILDIARGGGKRGSSKTLCDLPPALAREVDAVAQLPALQRRPALARAEALLIVSDEMFLAGGAGMYPAELFAAAAAARERLEKKRAGLARQRHRSALRPAGGDPTERRDGSQRGSSDIERQAGRDRDAQILGLVDFCRGDGGDVLEPLHFCAVADGFVKRAVQVGWRLGA